MAAMVAGTTWNVRLSVADLLARRHQSESLRKAIRLEPENGAYTAQLADDVYAADPQLAEALLAQAVKQNHYDAASWIQLGLLYEANNELAKAEAALLMASSVDATFLPDWSLANFYFRRQNADRFWLWAQRAVHIAPDDATPLFRLAWYVAPKVPVIEDRLQLQRPKVEAQLVNFLITQHEPQAVQEAAMHLLRTGSTGTVQNLLGACDWLVAAGHPELALSLWNGLAARHQIPYHALTPQMADTVSNGDFARQPTSLGFDWHMAAVEGVGSFLNSSPNALGFEFSGNEPDHFALIAQVSPVKPQVAYALLIDYGSDGISPESGLRWTVTDNRTGSLLGRTANLFAPQGGQAVACFTAPRESSFINLALGYERPPGRVRPEGKLTINRVRLSPAAGKLCAPAT